MQIYVHYTFVKSLRTNETPPPFTYIWTMLVESVEPAYFSVLCNTLIMISVYHEVTTTTT